MYEHPTDLEIREDWECRGLNDRCLAVLMVGPHCKTYEGVRCQLKAGHEGDHRYVGSDRIHDPGVDAEIVWRAVGRNTCDCFLTAEDGRASVRCQLPGGHDGPHRHSNTTWSPVAAKAGGVKRRDAVRAPLNTRRSRIF